jgi:hypothetical protein
MFAMANSSKQNSKIIKAAGETSAACAQSFYVRPAKLATPQKPIAKAMLQSAILPTNSRKGSDPSSN